MAPLIHDKPVICRPGMEQELFRRYRREHEPAVRDALVKRYLPLAHHLARRYHGGPEREDVLQVALLALVKAVDRFDPDRGSAFTSLATPTILGEIKRYFRDFGWTVRVPRQLQELSVRLEQVATEMTAPLGRAPTPAELAEQVGVDVEQVLDAQATSTAHRPVALDRPAAAGESDTVLAFTAVEEPEFAAVEDRADTDALLDRLPERERLVVKLRFQEDLLQREIAALLGISQMQVSRLLSRAIGQLQRDADDRPS